MAKPRITVTPENRQRVLRACDGCKRSRQKCDGEFPCSRCQHGPRPQPCTFKSAGRRAPESYRKAARKPDVPNAEQTLGRASARVIQLQALGNSASPHTAAARDNDFRAPAQFVHHDSPNGNSPDRVRQRQVPAWHLGPAPVETSNQPEGIPDYLNRPGCIPDNGLMGMNSYYTGLFSQPEGISANDLIGMNSYYTGLFSRPGDIPDGVSDNGLMGMNSYYTALPPSSQQMIVVRHQGENRHLRMGLQQQQQDPPLSMDDLLVMPGVIPAQNSTPIFCNGPPSIGPDVLDVFEAYGANIPSHPQSFPQDPPRGHNQYPYLGIN
ncbi:hypothetical protein BJ878DRAFT_201789 [Calycina marina]|uniref:Zn(2)-C6 fungal-type domain-containing protein n=1 Tax=Calycina marina TaxID=1763456 RepID=A0A9P7Z8D5_9HELO|nr:hypothetical protein BJ878DRAFT_201789 [Calycina marina]